MPNILSESQCIQHVDDSLIYNSCKANEATKCSSELERVETFRKMVKKYKFSFQL